MTRLDAIVPSWPAAVDQVADVHDLIPADDDIVAAWRQCVAGANDNGGIAGRIAGAANHVEPADDTGAEQVTVMQPVLRHDVMVKAVEIFFGEQLTGKEPRPAQAFEPTACRAYRPRVADRCRTAVAGGDACCAESKSHIVGHVRSPRSWGALYPRFVMNQLSNVPPCFPSPVFLSFNQGGR